VLCSCESIEEDTSILLIYYERLAKLINPYLSILPQNSTVKIFVFNLWWALVIVSEQTFQYKQVLI
jgi:prepilin signal peptidase PulO-like enzyme (type II secretory pathway)